MFLVVDVGNSHTVTGMYRDNKLIGQWRLKSDAKSTADELAIQYDALFTMAGIGRKNIKGIILASVVPTLKTAWVNCCRNHFAEHMEHDIFVVSVDNISEMITVKLPNPNEVGADRLVNAIAAWNVKKCKQVVIDFGTAITFDCVAEDCEYLGGSILPGIAISLDALANKTAKLPHIDVSEAPQNIIGRTTVQAMQSGILYGYGSMIDGLVQGIKNEMLGSVEEDFRVVATGGMAGLIAPYSSCIDTIDSGLTLRGLQLIYTTLVLG